jgi:beta-mannosidase
VKSFLKICGMVVLAFAVLGPGGSARAKDSGGPSGRTETLLSGADWKLGSFPMGVGEERKAYEIGFDDGGFKSVPVPAEIQLTLGLKGMDLFRQSKELSLINQSEWWYRKRFTLPAEQAGQSVRLVFEGVDYFTSVWLNGEKLGEHEGAYTSFSFNITSNARPGKENVLAVKVTSPWLLKDRGLSEIGRAHV